MKERPTNQPDREKVDGYIIGMITLFDKYAVARTRDGKVTIQSQINALARKTVLWTNATTDEERNSFVLQLQLYPNPEVTTRITQELQKARTKLEKEAQKRRGK